MIKLPATPDGYPDWNYMEQYMRSVMENCEKKYQTLVRISQEKHQVDTTAWGEFRVDSFFEVIPVKHKLSRVDLDDTGCPVYSSDTKNNGVFGFYPNKPEFTISDDNPVMVVFGDHTKSMNIVKESFCVMDNVKVLKPIVNNEMALLFLTTIWRNMIPDLGYARHWNVAKDILIKLPITSSGEPDWNYMEQYMKRIMQRQQNVVDALSRIA